MNGWEEQCVIVEQFVNEHPGEFFADEPDQRKRRRSCPRPNYWDSVWGKILYGGNCSRYIYIYRRSKGIFF